LVGLRAACELQDAELLLIEIFPEFNCLHDEADTAT
jgi:hypothetical protein